MTKSEREQLATLKGIIVKLGNKLDIEKQTNESITQVLNELRLEYDRLKQEYHGRVLEIGQLRQERASQPEIPAHAMVKTIEDVPVSFGDGLKRKDTSYDRPCGNTHCRNKIYRTNATGYCTDCYIEHERKQGRSVCVS